ncbi:hypothetical protein NFI96_005653 [Prochilodus magdalenae]|nr:hypothetical protein NFI96_005653 [Prochilodus magdalenae]
MDRYTCGFSDLKRGWSNVLLFLSLKDENAVLLIGTVLMVFQRMQEAVQGSGDRADVAQSPAKDGPTLDISAEPGGPRAVTFDLLNMVVSYKRMAIFLEPVTDALEVLRYLLGWRMPLCSLVCCLLLNVLFVTLTEVAWFSLFLLLVSVPAVLGYLGDRCQGIDSDTAVQKKKHFAVQRRELQTVHMSRQEAMLEVKGLLKRLDELLNQACVHAESAYKIIYWESSTDFC